MRLRRQISITWSGQSLNHALAGLIDHEDLSVWLDRRVDPKQKIDLVLQGVTTKEALTELARSCGLKVAYLGSVIYFGPEEAAEEIMALREKQHTAIKNEPKNIRMYWFHKSVRNWPRLSEPRELLQELFSGTPIVLQGVDLIPYDLWDARQLPRLTRIDCAALLLIGFDLTLHMDFDRKSYRVMPIERPVFITRQYSIHANQISAVAQLRRKFPDLNIEILRTESQPTALQVTGAWTGQQSIRQVLENQVSGSLLREPQKQDSQGPIRRALPGQQVYSLVIREQTLQQVLRQLALQLPVELTWDERQLAAAGYSLDIRISCKVQSKSLEQLLEAILFPVGLQFQRVGKEIQIHPTP